MSSISGSYKELNLVDGITANGDYPANSYLTLAGDYALAVFGTFDTATVEIVFFTENASGTLVEMPTSTDFTFTTAPEFQRFSFPQDAPFKVRLSSVGGSTSLSVNAHKLIK